MIVEMIIVILVTYLLFNKVVKRIYNKYESFVDKLVLILYGFIVGVPIVIYFLDRWNITELLEIMKNIEGKMWFEYISNYTSSVIGAILSSVISIYVVFY